MLTDSILEELGNEKREAAENAEVAPCSVEVHKVQIPSGIEA